MSKPEIVRRSDLSSLTCVSWRQMTSMWWVSASDSMMWRFAADNPSTLSCIMRRAGPTAWKSRSALSEGFFLALWPGIHKDSIRRWNLWFPSAGVFAKVLAGRATGTQITFPPRFPPYFHCIVCYQNVGYVCYVRFFLLFTFCFFLYFRE